MEATVFWRTFNAADIFLVPFPRSVPQHNPVSELYGQFLQPHVLVFALTSTVGPCIDRCVPSQIMSNQLNLPQVDFILDVSKKNGWKHDAKGLNTK